MVTRLRWGAHKPNLKNLIKLLVIVLPWALKRWVLQTFWGYSVERTARIGLAWVFPRYLYMGKGSNIGNLTACKGLQSLRLGDHATIGRANWITAFPPQGSGHFSHEIDRDPSLVIGAHAAITNRHLIDCTNLVTVGEYATIAGFRSQILTHSIDLASVRQSSSPVKIGKFSFVGTNCVILGGSVLPDCTVLGAKSLLNKAYQETHMMYGGVPARPIKPLPENLGYFKRRVGFVL